MHYNNATLRAADALAHCSGVMPAPIRRTPCATIDTPNIDEFTDYANEYY